MTTSWWDPVPKCVERPSEREIIYRRCCWDDIVSSSPGMNDFRGIPVDGRHEMRCGRVSVVGVIICTQPVTKHSIEWPNRRSDDFMTASVESVEQCLSLGILKMLRCDCGQDHLKNFHYTRLLSNAPPLFAHENRGPANSVTPPYTVDHIKETAKIWRVYWKHVNVYKMTIRTGRGASGEDNLFFHKFLLPSFSWTALSLWT